MSGDDPSRGRVLSLVGPRGSGKTTVGRRLAERLGVPFVDADHELERANGRTVAEIFAEDGEPHFRALEVATLAGLLAEGPKVLATGGGAVLHAGTRDRLTAAGPVVFLTVPPAVATSRTAGDADRPALTDLDAGAEAAKVAADRDPLYRAVAAAVVDGSGDADAVADAVLRALGFTTPGAAA